MKIFLILVLFSGLQPQKVELEQPNYIIYQSNNRASKAITQTFYFEFFKNGTPADYTGYKETEDNWAILEDGGVIFISKSYILKKTRFTCYVLCGDYNKSYSVTSKHTLSDGDEDVFQTLLLWNLISLFNPTNHEIRDWNETYYDYEVE